MVCRALRAQVEARLTSAIARSGRWERRPGAFWAGAAVLATPGHSPVLPSAEDAGKDAGGSAGARSAKDPNGSTAPPARR